MSKLGNVISLPRRARARNRRSGENPASAVREPVARGAGRGVAHAAAAVSLLLPDRAVCRHTSAAPLSRQSRQPWLPLTPVAPAFLGASTVRGSPRSAQSATLVPNLSRRIRQPERTLPARGLTRGRDSCSCCASPRAGFGGHRELRQVLQTLRRTSGFEVRYEVAAQQARRKYQWPIAASATRNVASEAACG